MYACYACVHACTSRWFWYGSMAGWVRRGMRAAPFSHLPVLSCRYSPLQPTPTGAFEKVRFAIEVTTRRNLRGMRGRAGRHAPKRCVRRWFAPEWCQGRWGATGDIQWRDRHGARTNDEVALIWHDIAMTWNYYRFATKITESRPPPLRFEAVCKVALQSGERRGRGGSHLSD